MGFYKTEGIVLQNRELREADQLITLFSLDRGKLKLVARGGKRIQSRLRADIQPFTQVRLMLHTGRSLDIITGSETIKRFYFRENFDKLVYAIYWVDLVNRITPEQEPNFALYYLLLETLYLLEFLEDFRGYKLLNHFFELRLINLAGYQPVLDRCACCQKGFASFNKKAWFSPEHGGVICPQCVQDLKNKVYSISLEIISLLQYWLNMKIAQFRRLKVSDTGLREMDDFFPFLLEYYLEQPIYFYNFIKSLGG